MLVYTVYRKTVRIKSENILKLLRMRKSRAFNYKFKIIYQGRQSVPKSGRSEGGRERNFGVYQTIAPKNLLLKVIFTLNRGFLPWIFGAELKNGSAYALVDMVSLAPLKINHHEIPSLFSFFKKNAMHWKMCTWQS